MAVFVAICSAAVKGSDSKDYSIHRGEFFEDTHPAYTGTGNSNLFIAAPASERAIAIAAGAKGL